MQIEFSEEPFSSKLLKRAMRKLNFIPDPDWGKPQKGLFLGDGYFTRRDACYPCCPN